MPGPPAPDRGRDPGAGPGGPPGRAGEAGPLLVLLGPTGTGKSETAVLLAEDLGGEIVGCDALQVYRGMDAGTAKPTPEQRRRVRHHLVDVADPRQEFSLGTWVRAAEEAVAAIAARGRVPIVAGGTGMYLRGLLRGVVAAPPRDPARRERLRALAGRFGTARLHRCLARRDPGAARRLPPGDAQRIVRALEWVLDSGTTWSARLEEEGRWAAPGERYRAVKVGLDLERAALAARLAARVEGFFAAGLVDEVRALLAAGVPPEANALKAIGYREVVSALRAGEDPAGPAVRQAAAAATRRYAKRQRTWFRGERDVLWLDAAEGPAACAARAAAAWRGSLW